MVIAALLLTGCDRGQHAKTTTITFENITGVDIEDYETKDSFFIDLKENTIEYNGEIYPVAPEKEQDLANVIYAYTGLVFDDEAEYWPQTDEYPEMLILFHYNIYYDVDGNKDVLRVDGANCYPAGWDDMIKELKTYIEDSDGQGKW